ncbi:MAG TPA: acyl-CoA dehydratase activase, partial [Thermoanaerobaculia bacterium]|nr:acyl-CoA dehydratase activase [Thermoanaerobaculia bacterium]
MRSIGFDSGSVATKAVLLDEQGRIEATLYRRRTADDSAALEDFLCGVSAGDPEERFHAGVVGIEHLPERVLTLNGIVAIAKGVEALHPGVRSIIEIGGHTSKFIDCSAGEVRDFATNEACAAGTGSFLEQQARRLELDVEELSALAEAAASGATIAGRCSVFAKSDMIHLQQKATPVADIAYGLCLAICRNALATLLKGRDAERPLVLGGGCARNRGILRAFAEVLGGAEPIASAAPGLEAAVGVALAARQLAAPGLPASEIASILAESLAAPLDRGPALPPL